MGLFTQGKHTLQLFPCVPSGRRSDTTCVTRIFELLLIQFYCIFHTSTNGESGVPARVTGAVNNNLFFFLIFSGLR